MGVYSQYSQTNYESVLESATFDSLVEDTTIEEAFEDNIAEAAFRVAYETTVNFNRMMQACAIEEFACFESTGMEMVYEGAKLDGFIEKVKAFFKSIWQKIQSIYKKAVLQFNSWFKSDKDFIKKYEKELNRAKNLGNLKGREVDIYEYEFIEAKAVYDEIVKKVDSLDIIAFENIDDIKSKESLNELINKLGGIHDKIKTRLDTDEVKEAIDKITSETDKLAVSFAKTLNSEGKDLMESITDYALGDFKISSVKEIPKELKNFLRGNDGEKETVKLVDAIEPAKNFLLDSATIKRAIDNALKIVKRGIDKSIRKCDSWRKSLNKDIEKEDGQVSGAYHTIVTWCIKIMQNAKTAASFIHGILISELKACSRQCKSVVVKAISNADKKPIEESLIESIQFI